MEKILKKIFTQTKDEAIKKILDKKAKIINFLYFASLQEHIIENKNNEYINALLDSDLILPDWIALKLFLAKNNIKISENLNWTDFTPYLLKNLKWKIHIWFYTVYDEKIGKSKRDAMKVKEYIQKNFAPEKIFSFVSHYNQRGKDFDFKKYEESLIWQYDYKIFLVWLWTPFQEIWTYKNKNFFKKHDIIVLNVWGLFDFWTSFEKRAPSIIRKLNLEWARRFTQNPKKNWKKVKNSFKLIKHLIKKDL